MLDPTDYADLEDLRQDLIDEIETRLDENELIVWTRVDQQFMFITSQIVVFDTQKRIEDPRQLLTAIRSMSPSSVFYHFIDARRRSPDTMDDFSAWLYGFGDTYKDLCYLIGSMDQYFLTLSELRDQLVLLFQKYFRKFKS